MLPMVLVFHKQVAPFPLPLLPCRTFFEKAGVIAGYHHPVITPAELLSLGNLDVINKSKDSIGVCFPMPRCILETHPNYEFIYGLDISLSSNGSPHSGQNFGGWAGSTGFQPHLSHW